MNAVVVGFAIVLAGLLVKGMLTDEIRGWLNRLPGWLLRRAAKQLGPDRQEIYEELWLPDLEFILHEDRPITLLVKATRMAAGLLMSTRREARVYRRAAVEKMVTADMRKLVEVLGDGGKSFVAQEYFRVFLEQMGDETRRRVFVDGYKGPIGRG